MKLWPWLALLVLLQACTREIPQIENFDQVASQERDRFYMEQVRPVLDQRCVSCHACYTASCQLNLADHEGIRRGATAIPLYEGSRLTEIDPTRLHLDADGADQWFQKGFHPVADKGSESLLMRLVNQRQENQDPVRDPVKTGQTCPADSDDMDDFLDSHAEKGMPYGLPPLSARESDVLDRWLNAGYPTLSPSLKKQLADAPEADRPDLKKWEDLLNQADPRSRLVARYLYEHLYLAALELRDQSQKARSTEIAYYRLVRSQTAAPAPIRVIPTRRPFDSPGDQPFYYRLQRFTETLTHKNLVVYTLDDSKWNRYQELFYKANWTIEARALPTYEPDVAANPFLAFQAIPAESRYQFLLDDARYFVATFIKGTVCEGETAVNVIQERFFIFFLDPTSAMAQKSDIFLKQLGKDLGLPSKEGVMDNFYWSYKSSQMDFVAHRQKAFAALYPRGVDLDDIWDGDGKNPQAALTVFRHFDNSYVVTGAMGSIPKTAWVMDYSIFERMYYLLVAGFDVFGNVVHQLSTRLYMDNLRVESEDLFLSFLPQPDRQTLRAGWYQGEWAEKKMEYLNPFGGVPSEPALKYKSLDHKAELIEKIVSQRFTPAVRGVSQLSDCCGPEEMGWKELETLTQARGEPVHWLPDVTLLLVTEEGKADTLFSLIHDKDHSNVAFLLGEEERLSPAGDSIFIRRGVYGSFPNFFVQVPRKDLGAFVQATLAVGKAEGPAFESWLQSYGVSRRRPEFWKWSDRIQMSFDEQLKSRGGVLDLSKYELW